MRLQPIDHARPGQRIQCSHCCRVQAVADLRADLDAAPFTYVCADCVEQHERVALDVARSLTTTQQEN